MHDLTRRTFLGSAVLAGMALVHGRAPAQTVRVPATAGSCGGWAVGGLPIPPEMDAFLDDLKANPRVIWGRPIPLEIVSMEECINRRLGPEAAARYTATGQI